MRRTYQVLWVTAAAFTALSPRAHLAAQQPERQGYLTTSDSARIFYRVAGSGPDTLIAIHGGPGVDLESIYHDFAPLAAHHVVIFYDQRGAGRSELPRDTARLVVARQIADLDEVRRHFGLRQVTLVAHSYGPLLAASYALAHPDAVRRMVFFGPVPPRRGDFWERFAANVRPRLDGADAARLAAAGARLRDSAQDAVRACRDYWAVALKPRVADPTQAPALIRSDLCASDPAGIRYGLTTTNRVVMASYGNWDLRDGLRQLQVPTLVVHGEQEAIPMDLVEEWVTSLPHARLVRVPRAAHFTYAERPDLVWPAVEAFLAEPQGGPGVIPGVVVRTDQIPALDTVVYRRFVSRAGRDTASGARTVVRRITSGPDGSRRLVVEQRFPAGAGEIVDTSIAELPTLRALGHRSHQPSRTMRFDFVADTAQGTVTTAASAPDSAPKVERVHQPLGGPLFDSNLIEMIVAALPLEPGLTMDVPFFFCERGGRVSMTVTVKDRATVTFPQVGPRDAWVVTVAVPGAPATFWIDVQTRAVLRGRYDITARAVSFGEDRLTPLPR